MARNGYLAEDGIRLVTVEDNDQLIATAAASFLAWKAASIAARRPIFIVEPAGAYRSAWVQNDMVDNPHRYNLNPNSKIRFGRSGQSHGWGNRVDIGGDLAWAIATGHLFGWSREYGANDPNHFMHDGRTAIHGAGSSGGGISAPAIQHPKEKDMSAFYRIKDGEPGAGGIFWQERPNTPLIPVSLPTWVAWAANGHKYADLSAADVNGLIAKWGRLAAPALTSPHADGAPGSVDFGPVVGALADLGTKIDALPAEIDRYADGRKQG